MMIQNNEENTPSSSLQLSNSFFNQLADNPFTTYSQSPCKKRGTSSLREKRDDFKREKKSMQADSSSGDQWMQRQVQRVESIQREQQYQSRASNVNTVNDKKVPPRPVS